MRRRGNETAEMKVERLREKAQARQERAASEQAELDDLVRKSIRLYGA